MTSPTTREWRQVRTDRLQDRFHHLRAVLRRVVLRPVHRLDVLVEGGRALREPGEVAVGKMDVALLHLRGAPLDEVAPDHVADAARTGMQHDPDRLRFVEAHLDEMVAAAQRAELPHPRLPEVLLHLLDLGILLDDLREPPSHRARPFPRASPPRPFALSCMSKPTGTSRSMAPRIFPRLVGRSLAWSESRTAFIPQPMSTPTAAGMTAALVGITLPTVAPIPACTSGIAAT
jgi:hypothetical protein